MTEPNAAAAEMLEVSASGYAAAAASTLLEEREEIRSHFGAGAAASWKAQFVQRMLELAAAVRVGEPDLFTNRIVWQKNAFVARQSDPADLRHGILSLQKTLSAELPQNLLSVVGPYLERAIAAFDSDARTEEAELDPEDSYGALALKYVAACLDGVPRRAIELVLDASRAGMTIETIYGRVLLPAQREIGRMWYLAEASIAEERVVTETTRRLMGILTHEQQPAADTGKSMLGAAVASDAHDIGIRAVCDLFEVAGWRVVSLGADVPPNEIANGAKFFDVDLIVLATTLTTQVKPLQATIEAIRAARGDDIKILVGGYAFSDAPHMWRTVGADGYAAEAVGAVLAGGELVGLKAAI